MLHGASLVSEVYEDWRQETGVKVIAVSIDKAQDMHKVKPLVTNHSWEYDVILDPNGELKRMLGVQIIPYTLVVDGQGKIAYRHTGYTDGSETELIEEVRKLISQ